MKNMIDEICSYLHDSGSVIWLRQKGALKDIVFLRPRWVISAVEKLNRRSLTSLEYEDLEYQLASKGIPRSRLVNEEKNNLIIFGKDDQSL